MDVVRIIEASEIKQEPAVKQEPEDESDEEIEHEMESNSECDQIGDESCIGVDSTKVKLEVKEEPVDTNSDQMPRGEEETGPPSQNDSYREKSRPNNDTLGSQVARKNEAKMKKKSKSTIHSNKKKAILPKDDG